jgi:hypothetical protein
MTMMKADGSFVIGCGKKERLLGKSLSPNQLTPNKFQESQVTEPYQHKKKGAVFISNDHL